MERSSTASTLLATELAQIGPAAFTDPAYKPGIIRHIVLFRFKPGTTGETMRDVKRRFLALHTTAKRNGKPYITSIDAGFQNSGEGADHGFELGFIVTFQSEGDRNYYVGTPIVTDAKFFDPEHQKFKDFVGPSLSTQNGVLVFDFNASDK